MEGGLHGPEKFIDISDFDYIITLNSMSTESVFQTYPERTTTMGDSDPVTTISPFQIISADDTIMPKLSTCKIHHTGLFIPLLLDSEYKDKISNVQKKEIF